MVPLRLGSSQRKRWERGKRSYTTTHVLKDSKGRGPPLELRCHVVVRYQAGKKWGKHGCQYLIYAALGEFSREEIAALYRGRFDIESSYRILGQALAGTSSRSASLRLLQVGVGILLQNECVVLKFLYASEGRRGPIEFRIRDEWLRFADHPRCYSGRWATASASGSPSRIALHYLDTYDVRDSRSRDMQSLPSTGLACTVSKARTRPRRAGTLSSGLRCWAMSY